MQYFVARAYYKLKHSKSEIIKWWLLNFLLIWIPVIQIKCEQKSHMFEAELE